MVPNRKIRIVIIGLVSLIAVSLALTFGMRKTVTLSVDGQARRVTTYAFKVGGLLAGQGITISPADELSPGLDAWLTNGASVSLVHAIPVQILADGKLISILSAERLPIDLLKQAGKSLEKDDLLLSNGKSLDPQAPFTPQTTSISLQLIRAVSFSLSENGETRSLTSSAPTLGAALWNAGITMFASDRLVPPADTPLTMGLSATLIHSRPVLIKTQAGEFSFRTSAQTVGEALEDAHLSLQGLDYCLPAADKSIPASGKISLVRVTEQVLLEQTPIPFETEWQPVSDLEVDSRSVVQAGEYGITEQRVRVRYENGVEASRKVEDEWVARQPVNRILGYGTNLVMKTTTVDGVTIQYWRSLTVWVTSYHPSETGSNVTATGALVQKGVVGVNPHYIPYHTRMYIPGYGYGEALDTGNIGPRWIDLAYPDNEYIPWHQYVTIYFLWPPPDNIVWVIP